MPRDRRGPPRAPLHPDADPPAVRCAADRLEALLLAADRGAAPGEDLLAHLSPDPRDVGPADPRGLSAVLVRVLRAGLRIG